MNKEKLKLIEQADAWVSEYTERDVIVYMKSRDSYSILEKEFQIWCYDRYHMYGFFVDLDDRKFLTSEEILVKKKEELEEKARLARRRFRSKIRRSRFY